MAHKIFGVVARVKAPEGYTGVWINIYKRGKLFQAGGSYKKRVRADLVCNDRRYDCVYAHVRNK